MEEFKIDFRQIDMLELKSIGISGRDLNDLFATGNSEVHEFRKFSYAIGYVKQTKFIHAVFIASRSVNFDLELLEVSIPNEEDIKRYWCSGKGKE